MGVELGASTRLIAFYLPQFHPIPENDAWWGKGFTEWTNVAKARPLFRGHYQPRIPADLGFYDLRVPETRIAQAELAREYGISGFCYWHYWFAGRRLLEQPFNDVLRSGKPDFPFCLGWANQSWSGIWHGAPDRLLLEQTYPGPDDDESHFKAVLTAFGDERYITIDGMPVFLVYKVHQLPQPRRFTDLWRELAIRAGLKGVYFIGETKDMTWVPEQDGFDAAEITNPGTGFDRLIPFPVPLVDRAFRVFSEMGARALFRRIFSRPLVFSYGEYVRKATPSLLSTVTQYPCVAPNWDNTPRSGVKGYVLHRSTPDLFGRHLRSAVKQVATRAADQRVVFVRSWNEWAEGNYLEPDLRHGRGYLETVKSEMEGLSKRNASPTKPSEPPGAL